MHQWSVYTSLPPHPLSEPPQLRWIHWSRLWLPVTAPAVFWLRNSLVFWNCWGVGEPPPDDLQVTQGQIGGNLFWDLPFWNRFVFNSAYIATPSPTLCCASAVPT